MSFFNALKQIQKMPYYQNYAAASGAVHNVAKHEDAVEDIFVQNNFQKVERSIPKEQRNEWLKDNSLCDLEDGTFVSQPCGTHESPDFILKSSGKVFFIECKSAKTRRYPTYNSGVPKKEYLYVFSNKKLNETCIFMGGDVLDEEHVDMINEHIAEARRRDEVFNRKMNSSHGVSYYTRPMIIHKGGNSVYDYFANPLRESIEENILENI